MRVVVLLCVAVMGIFHALGQGAYAPTNRYVK